MSQSALPPAEALTLVPLADIARGGMGVVQLCRATNGRLQGRALAVKRLNPALEEEPEFVNMFLDETWITATINSPHVVRAEAWGRDEDGLFLAVELVEGVSLSRLLKESKEKQEPFAERTVANIASQVCAGLAAAHELRGENGAQLGLVHRDLTPGNILVSFAGMVKIADFGIAKAEERLTSTRIGMMKGKPAYMAPEQARGGGIDGRADLFALGVVIFELLTGKRPWGGANDLETLVNVTTKDAPRLSDVRKTSPVFVEIVDKCLRKNPNERYTNAAEIKSMLDGWRRERGFESDDVQSLAAFVQRNTQQQQQWFRGALSGELSEGGVAFQDLEARIDRGRKAITGGAVSSVPSSPHGFPHAHPAGNGARPSVPPAPGPPDDEAKTQYLAQAPLPLPKTTPHAPPAAAGSTAPLTSTLMSESAPLPSASPAPAIPVLMGAAAQRPQAATVIAPAMSTPSPHAATVIAPSEAPPSRSLSSTVALSADDAAAMSLRLMQEAQASSARTSAPPPAMGLSGTMLVASPLSVPPPPSNLSDSRPSAIPAPPPPAIKAKKGSSGLVLVIVVLVIAALATAGFLLTR